MILVKTSLKPSTIHGFGCFTEELIEAGQEVWIFNEYIDLRIPLTVLSNFPLSVQEYLYEYGYVEIFDGIKVVVLCGDFSKHMNHSVSPNLTENEENTMNVAVRDINPGEELTCNYFHFDLDASRKLSLRVD